MALKLIGVDGDTRDAGRARFDHEARALARLQRPNLVSVFEAGEFDGVPYLAMDLVQGRTLEQAVAPGAPDRLPLSRVVEVLRDIARAVQYAHEQGVLHRDLKPSNVMLDAEGKLFRGSSHHVGQQLAEDLRVVRVRTLSRRSARGSMQ